MSDESNSSDCLFCRIIAGELPAQRVYEDDEVFGFHDIKPQAPVHCLLVPRIHIATLNDFDEAHVRLAGRLMLAAKTVASDLDLPGYRVAMNVNREGGQVVFHAHLHLLGGRQMKGGLG
jgi:histidine triad (HIT) family protein